MLLFLSMVWPWTKATPQSSLYLLGISTVNSPKPSFAELYGYDESFLVFNAGFNWNVSSGVNNLTMQSNFEGGGDGRWFVFWRYSWNCASRGPE